MSAANLTSAGQFAALGIISASASYTEMAVTQLIINLRYCLMSCSLSQKLDSRHSFLHRFPVAYGVTDEIFGVSVCKPGRLSPFYNYGLITAAVPGWAGGQAVRSCLRRYSAGQSDQCAERGSLRHVPGCYYPSCKRQPGFNRSHPGFHGAKLPVHQAARGQLHLLWLPYYPADGAHCGRGRFSVPSKGGIP